ncbi:MAG: hypothetical protein HRU80_05635 [Ignavibacteriales bacterium]|nr:MAG: hypothetical protein HRU80_05635 [Ignavibacteriales bacterium]
MHKIPVKHLIFLAALVLLNWGAGLKTGFLNDDFQIIGRSIPESIGEIFSPLVTGHVWGVYWRPLIRILYNIVLFFFGHNPFAFHAAGLVLFLGVLLVVYLTAFRLSKSPAAALITSSLFAVLPSRELPALWIADQVELLVFFFTGLVYLTSDSYAKTGNRKYLILSSLMMTGALLSKELAFSVLLLPALMWLGSGAEKSSVSRYLALTGVFAVLTGALLSYRAFVIGSNLFAAEHLSNTGVLHLLRNFILYIPTVFAGPDQFSFIMEWGYAGYVPAVLMMMFLAGIMYYGIRKTGSDQRARLIYLTGAGWFILFLIPVLPVYMRWYVFTASFGVILILSWILTRIYEGLKQPGKVLPPAVIILLVLASHNIFISHKWNEAAELMEQIGVNISANSRFVKEKPLVLWGVPDKLNRIPVMKLGQKEVFEYYSGAGSAEIYSPLRAELTGSSPEIQLLSADSSGFSLILYGGRFLQEGAGSKLLPGNEDFIFNYNGYSVKVETKITNAYPVSIAYISGDISQSEKLHLWFNGKEFNKLRMINEE